MGKQKLIIITGHFGSGKTELSLHLALDRKKQRDGPVYLCDMDVINPYFRSRDYEEVLKEQGIHLVAPKGELIKADLPIVTGEVSAVIESNKNDVIIDVGGDKEGALSIGQFSNKIQQKEYDFWFVVNGSRPYVSTTIGILQTISQIERASRLNVNGIINNTHLGDDFTSPEDVLKGEALCKEVAASINIPYLYSFVSEGTWARWDKENLTANLEKVKVFQRKLLTPWS